MRQRNCRELDAIEELPQLDERTGGDSQWDEGKAAKKASESRVVSVESELRIHEDEPEVSVNTEGVVS